MYWLAVDLIVCICEYKIPTLYGHLESFDHDVPTNKWHDTSEAGNSSELSYVGMSLDCAPARIAYSSSLSSRELIFPGVSIIGDELCLRILIVHMTLAEALFRPVNSFDLAYEYGWIQLHKYRHSRISTTKYFFNNQNLEDAW